MVPGPVLDQHLAECGLLRFFQVRAYSCDVGVKKPHRRIFLAALRALNIRPQDTIFVGDKYALDVKGARRLGMITVLKVRVGMPPKRRPRADYVIKHLTELPRLLEQIGPDYEETTPLLPPEALPVAQFRTRAFEPLIPQSTVAPPAP
jgi:FMN phosphatase YigB (HAD superfamily)